MERQFTLTDMNSAQALEMDDWIKGYKQRTAGHNRIGKICGIMNVSSLLKPLQQGF